MNSRFYSCLKKELNAEPLSACAPGAGKVEAKIVKFQIKTEKPNLWAMKFTSGVGGWGGDAIYSIDVKGEVIDCDSGRELYVFESSETNKDIQKAIDEITQEIAEESIKGVTEKK